jgi:hypothetical protein
MQPQIVQISTSASPWTDNAGFLRLHKTLLAQIAQYEWFFVEASVSYKKKNLVLECFFTLSPSYMSKPPVLNPRRYTECTHFGNGKVSILNG